MQDMAVFPENSCIACGFCASQCPACAINIRRLDPRGMQRRIEAVLKQGHLEVTFACVRSITSRQDLTAPNTVWWDCLKILRQGDLLTTFDPGAAGL